MCENSNNNNVHDRAWKRKIFASVPKDQQKSLYFELSTVLDTKDLQTFEVLLSGFLKKWEDIPEFVSYFRSEYAAPNRTS